jgi:hypothetical protein
MSVHHLYQFLTFLELVIQFWSYLSALFWNSQSISLVFIHLMEYASRFVIISMIMALFIYLAFNLTNLSIES